MAEGKYHKWGDLAAGEGDNLIGFADCLGGLGGRGSPAASTIGKVDGG